MARTCPRNGPFVPGHRVDVDTRANFIVGHADPISPAQILLSDAKCHRDDHRELVSPTGVSCTHPHSS
jgi:hypothetical protein